MTVKVPPGVRDGHKLRLSGKGEMPPGGRAGELILTIHLEEHPFFWMEGDDLQVRVHHHRGSLEGSQGEGADA